MLYYLIWIYVLVLYWYCMGTVLVLYWYCIGTVLVLYWYCIGTVLVMYWYCIGTVLVLYWYCIGTVLVLYWYCIGTVLVLSWYCIGTVLVLYWYCLGTVLVLYWYCIGTVLVLSTILFLGLAGVVGNVFSIILLILHRHLVQVKVTWILFINMAVVDSTQVIPMLTCGVLLYQNRLLNPKNVLEVWSVYVGGFVMNVCPLLFES